MKNLIPKRRFEEFKDSDPWEQRKLGELAEFKQGLQVDLDKQSSQKASTNVRFIRIVDYTQHTQDLRFIEFNSNLSFVDKNDIVMVRYGASAGFVGRGIKGVIANNMFVVTPDNGINKSYLYSFLKMERIYELLNKSNGSSAMPALNFGAVSNINIIYPKVKEQIKIGAFFAQLDNLITLHQRKLDKLKETKSAYLSEMFPKEGEVYPKRRFAGFTDPWEQRKLEELDFIISDGNYGELYPKANELLSEGVPFIRVNNLVDGYLVHKDLVYISEKQHSVLTSGHLKANDILITTRGEIGKIALVDSSFENANINAQICLIRTQENMASKYLHQYLQTNLSQMEITSFQTGSALKQLPKKRLGDITINYPSLMEEQIQIGNFFTNLDNLITLHQRKLDKLQALKQAYLSEMFV